MTRTGRAVWVAGAAIGVASAALYLSGSFESWETRAFDGRLRSIASGELDSSLVIVEAGPGDLSAGGRRVDAGRVAGIVGRLNGLGAAVIAFDDPVEGVAGEVSALAKAAALHGRVIFAFRYPAQDDVWLYRGLPPVTQPGVADEMRRAAIAIGFTNRRAGGDGVLRRFTPMIGDQAEIGLAVASADLDHPIDLPRQAPMPGARYPLGPGASLLIRFDQAASSLRIVALDEVLSGAFDVHGKTVIVGAAPAAFSYQTPLGQMPSVAVTAEIASQLVKGRGIARAPQWVVVLAVIAVALALAGGAARARAAFDFAVPLVAGALLWVFAGLAMRAGTWIDVFPIYFVLAAHVVVVPSARAAAGGRAFISKRREGRATQASGVFFEGMVETLVTAAFGQAGSAWTFDETGPRPAGVRDERIPAHLAASFRDNHPVETNRDEGQFVLIPFISEGSLRAGVVVLRARGVPLAPPRLQLIGWVAHAFAARLSAASTDPLGALADALAEVARIAGEKDHFSAQIPGHLAGLVSRIAAAMGISSKNAQNLAVAARLHHIGKIGVPDAVLDSAERLSDEEYERVKKHPEIGSRILETARVDRTVGEIVEAHHERWDGRGYPNGLSGAGIPMGARILAVADAIVSITQDRPYRRGLPAEVALDELKAQRGKMFDPAVVDATIELAASDPSALVVPRAEAARAGL
jgi:HD-GYP domain-containing protein (c-di-GMP phosphodiesterase class II)/CHASE2 domain-containing sensor protein